MARASGLSSDQESQIIRDYFNLSTPLGPLAELWAKHDSRFSKLQKFIQGARVLRQDPLECLLQFICSSNNHISRIHGMVDRLCSAYGTPLPLDTSVLHRDPSSATPKEDGLLFYCFPNLQQLGGATEEALRAAGFGYRAKFIVGTVAALRNKEGGGEAWLRSLRDVSYAEASEALQSLPGVGPKVAACVCLFSLDKHAAIPVDTHVWQLACRHYLPHLRGKTLTKPLMATVEQALVARFGPYAGWAHNTLFIAELASQRHLLVESPADAVLKPALRGSATEFEEAALPVLESPAKIRASASNASDRVKRAAEVGTGGCPTPVPSSPTVLTPQQQVPVRSARSARQRKRRLSLVSDTSQPLSPKPLLGLC
eukprot:jgi/Botrbrau1/20353/Bobra.0006s0021.2